jgi:hypothetical protein
MWIIQLTKSFFYNLQDEWFLSIWCTKEKHQAVQKKNQTFIQESFYNSCGSHNLNWLLLNQVKTTYTFKINIKIFSKIFKCVFQQDTC